MSPLDYVNNQIAAEVIRSPASELSSHPTSSSQVAATESSWDKRGFLHPRDAARFMGRPGSGGPQVESSSQRDWPADRYGGRSPMREEPYAGKRSPRPAVHSQSAEENVTPSSMDDRHTPSSSIKPSSNTMIMRGAYGRERIVPSPHMMEGYPRSPRTYTPDGRPPSASGQKSPKFPISSDMCGSSDDMRPNQSDSRHSLDSLPRRPSSQGQSSRDSVDSVGREEAQNVTSQTSDSPHSQPRHSEEGRGLDSSGHVERFSPATEGNHAAIPSSSRDHYMEVDSSKPRPGHPAYMEQRMNQHRSPGARESPSSSGVVSSSAPRFMPYVGGENLPSSAYPPHSRYLYGGQQPPASGPPQQQPSPSISPASRITQKPEPSPLLSAQYETLSDDE